MTTQHATDRALERYSLNVRTEDWSRAVLDIIDTVAGSRTGALLIRRSNDANETWLVRVSGVPMFVVYNPENCAIVTALRDGRLR